MHQDNMAPKNNKSLANALYDLEQEEAKSQKRISDARAKRSTLNMGAVEPCGPQHPPQKVMNTSAIYGAIAKNSPFKKQAVKDIVEKFLNMACKQAKMNGSFEMASLLQIKVETEYFPRYWSARHRSWIYRRNAPPKKFLKLVPMKFMKRKVLAF